MGWSTGGSRRADVDAPDACRSAGPGDAAPDPEEGREGLEAAPEADPGVGRVEPEDRHLRDRVAEPAREEERLDVERETVDGRPAEDLPRGVGAEELEAALGVVDARDGEEADEEVEELPARDAEERLPLLDERLVDGAGADRHGGPRGKQLVDLLDRRREVGVGHEDLLPGGREDPFADGRSLSAVPWQAEDAEVETEAGGGLLRDGRGPVRGAVVDDEDLDGELRRAREDPLGDPREGDGEALLLVVGGDDERQGRRSGQTGLAS